MTMKAVSLKCPDCGAALVFEGHPQKIFCTYCGTEILLVNENEYIYRNIDEARLKQAETEQLIRLKEEELKLEKYKTRRRDYFRRWMIGLVLFIGGFILLSFFGPQLGDEEISIGSTMAFIGLFSVLGGMLLILLNLYFVFQKEK